MNNIQKIKEDFIKVIQHSQQIEDPKVDKLFDAWLDGKRDIIEAMGGKFIYEIEEPFTFELSKTGKEERVQSFINMCWESDLEELGDFLLFEKDSFFKNKCEKDYQNIVI